MSDNFMLVHTANQLFSKQAHGPFNAKYNADIAKLFANLQILETSLKKYRAIPLHRKQERLKQSVALFRIYWQNALKILLPYTRSETVSSQRLFMRYALVHTDNISKEELKFLKTVALQPKQPSLILYLDEWFHNISRGEIVPPLREGAHKLAGKKGSNKSNINFNLIRESAAIEEIMNKICHQSKCSATPFLHKNDLSRQIRQQLASRETVQKVIHLVQNIDPQVFTRKLLKKTVNLEPYVVLAPSYADVGACWEAFDRMERATSRGRIVIPLYAADTQKSILVALANYRWETAKLAAGGYWLQKGLTGGFYDLYRKHSLPGQNEEQAFVIAYCEWVLEEARGKVCFHPELREFFWREIPFKENRKKMLAQHFGQFRDIVHKEEV